MSGESQAKYQREYHQKHRERRKAEKRKRRQERPIQRVAERRRHYQKHRDRIKAYGRKYRQVKAEQLKASKRAHYRANKDRLNAKAREKRQARPEAKTKYNSAYYEKNRARLLLQAKAYRQRRPKQPKGCQAKPLAHLERERHRQNVYRRKNQRRLQSKNHKRRVEKAGGSYEYVDLDVTFAAFHNRCAHCGVSGERVPFQADHIHPVTKRGDHARNNLVPSCKDCNGSKSARLLPPRKVARLRAILARAWRNKP